MFNFTEMFKRGAAQAPASELLDAIRKIEAERQTLREEEQRLVGERQRLLLEGDDAEIDKVEARMNEVYRQCERLDLRIPALREAWEAKAAAERSEADKRAFDEATAQRLAIAERIDVKLAELGTLFDALEKPAAILRALPKRGGINGPMSEFRLDGAAMGKVLLHHVPTLARALGIEAHSSLRPATFHAVESEFMSMLRGIRPVAPMRPEPIMPTPDALDADEHARALANRGLGAAA